MSLLDGTEFGKTCACDRCIMYLFRFSGTINNNTGLFPVASVQLGFEDIPALEEMGCFIPTKKETAEKEVPLFFSTHQY